MANGAEILLGVDQMIEMADPFGATLQGELPAGVDFAELYQRFANEAKRLVYGDTNPPIDSDPRTRKVEAGEGDTKTIFEVTADRRIRHRETEVSTEIAGPRYDMRMERPLTHIDGTPTQQIIRLAIMQAGRNDSSSSFAHSSYLEKNLAELGLAKENIGWVLVEGNGDPEDFVELDDEPGIVEVQQKRLWVATQIAQGFSFDQMREADNRVSLAVVNL